MNLMVLQTIEICKQIDFFLSSITVNAENKIHIVSQSETIKDFVVFYWHCSSFSEINVPRAKFSECLFFEVLVIP